MPPGVTINAPTSGAVLPAGNVSVSGTAGDNVIVQSVKVGIFKLDGTTVHAYKAPTGLTAWTTSFDMSSADGPYQIKVEATDPSGNKTTVSGNFTIQHVDPPLQCPAGFHPENGVCVPDVVGGNLDQFGIAKIRGDSSPADTRTTFRYNRTQSNTRDQFIFDDVEFLPMEVTTYEKVSFYADDERGFKVWGGNHSGSGDNNTTRQGRCYGAGINMNGTPHLMKEYPHHPDGEYSLENDYLKYINPVFPKNGSLPTLGNINGRTIGHKYIIYLDQGKAFMEYYVDTAPFVNGKPANAWQLMYTAVDDGTWSGGDLGTNSAVFTTNQGTLYGGDGKVFIRNDKAGTSGSSTPGTTEYGYTVRKINQAVKLRTMTGQW